MVDTETMVNAQEPTEARKLLVDQLQADVAADKKHHDKAFSRMKADLKFARGHQWQFADNEDRYTANITQRHIKQRVSTLYAKNPTAVARLRQRMMSTVWDGNPETYMSARTMLEAGIPEPLASAAQAIIQDAEQTIAKQEVIRRIGRTLELLYHYQIDEQAHAFKIMMKRSVRHAVATGVGWIKLGFQRAMQRKPEIEARINDVSDTLAQIERLARQRAANDIDDNNAEMERLQLLLTSLQQEPEMVVREGLVFDWPMPWSVIPDRNCAYIREFIGCRRVTQEFLLTPNQIQEIYGVDVGKKFKAYDRAGSKDAASTTQFRLRLSSLSDNTSDERTLACVWEIWDRVDGLIYVVCDGHPDFLQEPAAPDVWTERFWPFFSVTLNECEDEEEIYPLSDVSLIKSPQREINRARQGLREHRRANRPKTAVPSGLLSDEDRAKLQTHPANAVLELAALQPGQSIDQVLQAVRPPGIDPNLYEVNPAFQDILRTVGTAEANLGGTSGATATENAIAEQSRTGSTLSETDDLDDTLTQLARAAGQILLGNMSEEMVKEIVGEGAAWPTLSRAEIAKEIMLEIEAGSSGRPQKQQDVQTMRELVPLLIQIPGVSPVFLARELIKRLDDRIDLTQAMMPGLTSIQVMNALAGTGAPQNAGIGDARRDPMAQGPQGAANMASGPPQPGGSNVLPMQTGAQAPMAPGTPGF